MYKILYGLAIVGIVLLSFGTANAVSPANAVSTIEYQVQRPVQQTIPWNRVIRLYNTESECSYWGQWYADEGWYGNTLWCEETSSGSWALYY
ncbi:hypothetical protein ABZ942_42240 [Nocardia sp. NPDC046473]|uniref:hypothetical protein n=1 Tax=Nocardia sp. NPDC046473 TaxID=3155733 RepID=UPI0034060A5D